MRVVLGLFLIFTFMNLVYAGEECKDAQTTYEFLVCNQNEKDMLDENLNIYIKNIIELNKDNEKFINYFNGSNVHWSNFINNECASLYVLCGKGSGCGANLLFCKNNYTKQRLNFLWNEYITRIHFDEPLPEPPAL